MDLWRSCLIWPGKDDLILYKVRSKLCSRPVHWDVVCWNFICKSWPTWIGWDTWRSWRRWTSRSRHAGVASPHSPGSRCMPAVWTHSGSPAARRQTSRRRHGCWKGHTRSCMCSRSAQWIGECRTTHQGSGRCWCPCLCTYLQQKHHTHLDLKADGSSNDSFSRVAHFS